MTGHVIISLHKLLGKNNILIDTLVRDCTLEQKLTYLNMTFVDPRAKIFFTKEEKQKQKKKKGQNIFQFYWDIIDIQHYDLIYVYFIKWLPQ